MRGSSNRDEFDDIDWQKEVKKAAKGVMKWGRGAVAEITQRKVQKLSYGLEDTHFQVVKLTSNQSWEYSEINGIYAERNHTYRLNYEGGDLIIKPPAMLVAGRTRVPIGWDRNGMEVPYVMLIEELAARCGAEIERT